MLILIFFMQPSPAFVKCDFNKTEVLGKPASLELVLLMS